MPAIDQLDPSALRSLQHELVQEHAVLVQRGLRLNIARGKPSAEQLDLSNDMLSLPGPQDYRDDQAEDLRNYGGDPRGLAGLRELMMPFLGVPAAQIVAGGNSSLAMMHDCVTAALLKGVPGGTGPWAGQSDIAFLCPAPGYEKHHQICSEFGIRLIPVAVTPEGPDMDQVEHLAADPAVKGMWCVPTYANPTGEIYSDAVVARLASMRAAADFRLFWDDAYLVHHLGESRRAVANIIDACAAAGHPDRPLVFASTSKITFAQAGVGFLAASPANIDWYLARIALRGVGPDKLNQLRHLRFLRDADGLRAHMEKHRALLAPKFAAILDALRGRLDGWDVASWSMPQGGYFINIEAMPGTARRAVELAAQAGLTLTVAGSTWPDGSDPKDSNIRIAPSFASLSDVEAAAEIIPLAILLAAVERRAAN